VTADSGDPGQLGQHPHGLAVDRDLSAVVPLEVAVPTGREREAFDVGLHPKTQGSHQRPKVGERKALLSRG